MPKFENADRPSRTSLRVAILIAVPILLIAGGFGYREGRRVHLERTAACFFAEGDFNSASLVCRRLLQNDPRNLRATKLMARLAGMVHQPDALEWFRRAEALAPNDENHLASALAATERGQLKMADASLAAVSGSARETTRFHEVAGALSIAKKNFAEAAAHFEQAVALAPDDAQLRLNLAAVRMAGTNRENGRRELEEMTRLPATRLAALRALLSDALSRREVATAEKWSAELRSEHSLTFSDRIQCLDADALAGRLDLAPVEAVAGKSSADVATLLAWMNRHAHAREAISWAATLPTAITTPQPVPLALAESYSCAQDWRGLSDFVAGANWKSAEPLRLAVAGHAVRHLAKDTAEMEAQNYWKNAIKSAQRDVGTLFTPAELFSGWGFRSKLTRPGGRSPAEASAPARPWRHCKANIASEGTRTVCCEWRSVLELNPDDVIAANNCASLGLLLQNDAVSRRLAERLHQGSPNNPAFTATWAFALHLAGLDRDALNAMETLPPAWQRVPAIAVYEFIFRIGAGDVKGAEASLASAEHATLLPEEKQLFSAAHQKFEEAEHHEL